MGPVQVLVVGFDHPRFTGEVLAEFERLGDAGIVRLVDLLVLSRSEDGTLETTSPPDGARTGPGALAAALLGAAQDGRARDTEGAAATEDDPGAEATWSLDAVVPPGSAAAVALIEHIWAEPLTAAIERAHGRPLDESWLGPEDRRTLDRLVQARATGTP